MLNLLIWIEKNATGTVGQRRLMLNSAYDAVEKNDCKNLKMIANRCGKSLPPQKLIDSL